MLRRGLLLVALAAAITTTSFGQTTSTLVFGNWSAGGSWDSGVPNSSTDAIIASGDIVTLDANGAVQNLTIQAGALLYANTSSPVILDVHGNLTIEGTLGNGATIDGIIIRLYSTSTTISGSGDFDALRLLYAGSADGTLAINRDVNLRGTGPAFYNVATGGSDFDVTLASGSELYIPSGNWSLDGAAGNGANNEGGTFTVNGTLNVGGNLYLESNNTAGTGNAVALTVANGGVVEAAQASTSASGTDRFTLTLNSGAKLDFTGSGNFGALAGNTNFTFNSASTVEYSGASMTFNHPDSNTGDADTDVDNLLVLSGTGTKTFDNGGADDLTINETLTVCGSTSISVPGTLTFNSTLTYNGSGPQTVGAEWPTSGGPTDVIIDNPDGVTMTGNRSLSGTLTMTDGDLLTDGYTLDLGTTGSISGESNASRVIGIVKATRSSFGSAQTFGGIGFEMASGGTSPDAAVTIERSTGELGKTDVGGNVSVARKFDMTYSGSVFSKDVTLAWLPAEDNGKTLVSMEMYGLLSGDWGPLSASPVNALATRTVTETVGEQDIYTVTDSFNPLPVELVSFDAVADYGDVLLKWETASELNNAGFKVEHASHGAFEEVDFVEGHGTVSEPKAYSYRMGNLEPGTHLFRLKQVDYDGTFEYSPEVEVTIEVPGDVMLTPAFPNPFNPTTTFSLSVARSQHVRVVVFDVMGRRIATLHDGVVEANQNQRFAFDASNLPSGMYFYRASGETFMETKSMVLQK